MTSPDGLYARDGRGALEAVPEGIADDIGAAGRLMKPGEPCVNCGRTYDPTTLDVRTAHRKCGHLSLCVIAGDSDILLTTVGCWVRAQIEAGRNVAGLRLPLEAEAKKKEAKN